MPFVNRAAAPSTRRAVLLALTLAACLLFLGLGSWQVARRAGKIALIERVEQRVHAPAEPAPGRTLWPLVGVARDEYRHVAVQGRYLYDRSTLVQAVTERGAGYWLMTPLRQSDGSIVLVNRGYVAAGWRPPPAQAADGAAVGLTGLLRVSEPGGGFLRHNDATANRWYSRDVAAIAAARGLTDVAPYFIDADAGATDAEPVGGLTVIHFHNNHLVYALTWYALALLAGTAAVRAWRGAGGRALHGGAGA